MIGPDSSPCLHKRGDGHQGTVKSPFEFAQGLNSILVVFDSEGEFQRVEGAIRPESSPTNCRSKKLLMTYYTDGTFESKGCKLSLIV